jgi:hypothetical protein
LLLDVRKENDLSCSLFREMEIIFYVSIFLYKQDYALAFSSLILLLSIASCSDRDHEIGACAITVDSVEIIDSKVFGDKSYYLVHRITGWQDKVEILEFYDEKPVFDTCSKPSVEPIDGDSLEMSKTVSHVFLNIKERKLDIVYKDSLPMKIQKDSIKLEIK